MNSNHTVFITGGTGYIGGRLVRELCARGHNVRALVRSESERKLSPECTPIRGDALDGSTYVNHIHPADTFIHLVGVSHPSPAKAEEFRRVDFVAAREAFSSATKAGIKHFMYLSVAQPAPTMRAYVQVRMDCEALLRETGMNATILRPWYVLGPGHWWPYLLLPGYVIAGMLPPTREIAQRLGLLTLREMVRALVWAVENPVQGSRVLGVQEIKRGSG